MMKPKYVPAYQSIEIRRGVITDLGTIDFTLELAKSNIYWNGSYLTFSNTSGVTEDYQGVYFKWGSLVGISPKNTATLTTAWETYYPTDMNANNSTGWEPPKKLYHSTRPPKGDFVSQIARDRPPWWAFVS
jgi:hypothetical protein